MTIISNENLNGSPFDKRCNVRVSVRTEQRCYAIARYEHINAPYCLCKSHFDDMEFAEQCEYEELK